MDYFVTAPDTNSKSSMNIIRPFVFACTALAGAHGAALADDGALAPLQVPAKNLPVPTDVSPEMQRIISAPRNPASNVLWKTGEEWRAAANAQAAKIVQAIPAMRERLHVAVQPGTMDGVKVYVVTPDVIPPEHRDKLLIIFTAAAMCRFPASRERPRQSSWRGLGTSK
jgi:monoterpene epsilon-lactone hydrolase